MPYFKIIFILIGLSSAIAASAQDILALLGQPYSSADLTDMRKNFRTVDPEELLIPAFQVLRIDYHKDGIRMEYNANTALYQVGLYDSGYSYNAYKGSLPFGIKWGMGYSQIEKKTGLLEFVKENEFIRRYADSLYQVDFYFTGNRLVHLKVSASPQTIIAHANEIQAATGFRLLPTGYRVDGNVNTGVGTMRWGTNAATYTGDWLYGVPHGRGEYVDSVGNTYTGEFKLGFFWGQGNFYSEAGKYSYSGGFVMGKKHGKGRISFTNGIVYVGEYMQDIMQGNGTYTMGQDYLYQGEFKNGQFNGKGKLTTQQGYIDGYFKDGKPHGICLQAIANGTYSIQGEFVKGIKQGPFTITNLGEVRTAIYQDDIEVKVGPIDPSLLKQ